MHRSLFRGCRYQRIAEIIAHCLSHESCLSKTDNSPCENTGNVTALSSGSWLSEAEKASHVLSLHSTHPPQKKITWAFLCLQRHPYTLGNAASQQGSQPASRWGHMTNQGEKKAHEMARGSRRVRRRGLAVHPFAL